MATEMIIRFPGKKKVVAEFDGFTVATDQPCEAGGDGGAPGPFDLFLASLGTCAGIFVLSFCQKRGIATDGLEIRQTLEWDEARHLATKIVLEISLPKDFPEKYRESLIKTADLCTVKRHLFEPPQIEVRTKAPGNPQPARI
jgi:ribosomal protein S12 methylthiotransferase accessory factor